MTGSPSLAAAFDRVAAHLVGRERELTLLLAAVAAGRDIILEGPPGTSKGPAVTLTAVLARQFLVDHSPERPARDEREEPA